MQRRAIMSILCPSQTVTLPFCTPSCTRWSQINAGQPVTVYHDKSQYDRNCRPIVNEPDPQYYLDIALDHWNAGYSCGDLFVMVEDPALAQVMVVHDTNNFGGPLGTATCACDAEDDVCVRQVDHSQIFSIANPAILTMYCQPGTNFASVRQYLNIWIHELGHILGMGHVYNTVDSNGNSVDSIMGLNLSNLPLGTHKPFDQEQLDNRHPCGCQLTSNFMPPIEIDELNTTSSFCPVCHPSPDNNPSFLI